jgi:hypothetical protein
MQFLVLFCVLCRARREVELRQHPTTKVAESCAFLHVCHALLDAPYLVQILCVFMQIMKLIGMFYRGSCVQMKGHKGGRAPKRKTNTGAHLNARAQQSASEASSETTNLKTDAEEGASEESSVGTGGADTITKLSHYETISSGSLT